MSKTERAELMDRLDELDKAIEEAQQWEWSAVIADHDEDVELARSERCELECEWFEVLNRFPEVKYWPTEAAT